MDFWTYTDERIKAAALKHYGRMPNRVIRQTGLWAYVEFTDGSWETVYEWMM